MHNTKLKAIEGFWLSSLQKHSLNSQAANVQYTHPHSYDGRGEGGRVQLWCPVIHITRTEKKKKVAFF